MKHLILATAGHVDHGKSALVQALTGTDPDRLPEEKARGITIDLGFAELLLAEGALHLGLVDVPGHEDFVKNMVAGVGSVDLALLVVAADDGWMPQTEEHLQILMYLGVRQAVIALTKSDLVPDMAASVSAVREQLRETPFAEAAIIPTSTRDPASIDRLRATLAETCARIPQPREVGKPRLAVDRAFSLRGVGTVVTGTLSGGCFEKGQLVTIQPSGTSARVRTIQSHGRDVATAGPGMRVALNLSDVPVAKARGAAGVRRGSVITAPASGAPTLLLDARLECSSRLARIRVRSGSMVRVHQGTASAEARVRLVPDRELGAGQSAMARLSFAEPVFAFLGDRFILRDSPGRRTLAGGIVLDPQPLSELDAGQRRLLDERARAPHDLETALRTELARDRMREVSGLLAQSPWSLHEVQHALARVSAGSEVKLLGDLAADAHWWSELTQRAGALVDAVHQSHPDRSGLELTEFRSSLGKLPPRAADALVADLCRNGFGLAGTCLKRAAHRPVLPPSLQAEGTRIRAALAAQPLAPPARKELAPTGVGWHALRFLVETGEVIEISPELVMSARAVHLARDRVRQFVRAKGPVTASEVREMLGTNRRVIIPLLEWLDREGVTRRIGDKRVLKPE